MSIRNLFIITIVFSVIRLSLWVIGPYLIIEFDISVINLGLVSGGINMLFWIFMLWLVFKIFMINELKKYLKFLVPLVILIILISKGQVISRFIWDNPIVDYETQLDSDLNSNIPEEYQTNKVYINSDYSEDTIEAQAYVPTGKIYRIFIFNETANPISANTRFTIKPNESHLFEIPDTMGIALDNGIQFFFGETEGLEVIDNNIQVTGLGGDWLDKYNAPDEIDWAFSIKKAGKGDPIPE